MISCANRYAKPTQPVEISPISPRQSFWTLQDGTNAVGKAEKDGEAHKAWHNQHSVRGSHVGHTPHEIMEEHEPKPILYTAKGDTELLIFTTQQSNRGHPRFLWIDLRCQRARRYCVNSPPKAEWRKSKIAGPLPHLHHKLSNRHFVRILFLKNPIFYKQQATLLNIAFICRVTKRLLNEPNRL